MNSPEAAPYSLEHFSGSSAEFSSLTLRLRISFFSEQVVRITFTRDKPFATHPSPIVTGVPTSAPIKLSETTLTWTLASSSLAVELNKATGALRYLDTTGQVILREPERGGRWLTPKTVTRNIFEQSSAVELQSIDGARAAAARYTTVEDRQAFEAKLEFVFAPDEALFGLGSHEEGYSNLRGRSRELYQQNLKAVVPHLVSTRGYGLLLDCGSLMTFHDDALGSYWWAECVDELDLYFIYGGTYEGVLHGYHSLTGTPPLPPRWAFGYLQSKERYVTADEIAAVATEYRRRSIPLDAIVLDWKSWPNGSGWGQKSFDPVRFPNPAGLTETLHSMGIKLMVSIWPIMTGGCPDQLELLSQGLMLGNGATCNALLPQARAIYWSQAERGLFRHGIDAWWCDCTEPFEADWSGAAKPEPHARLALNTAESRLYMDPATINLYSLYHSQGIYEGQRSSAPQRRVLNLTRSSYAGQSRYGTVTWNGDVSATWETLRRSIAEGLNFCATGEPYWTVDIGGFFVDNRADLWFWRGDYPAGCRGLTAMDALSPDPEDTGSKDLGYWELYTRWLEWAAFLPMFRSHGTDVAREIWRFGEEGSPFYDAIAANIRLRYRLLPYIYSVAASVTFIAGWMICHPALESPNDLRTHALTDEYFFGPALLVCPVTEPMFYTSGSQPLSGISQTRAVYLPASPGWYDFHTNQFFTAEQVIEAAAPLERIPVFVRAGSILPMAAPIQHTGELPDAAIEIHIYTGANCSFTFYEDSGDSYDYERGLCSRIPLAWNDQLSEFTISARHGAFPGMQSTRKFQLYVHRPNDITPLTVDYTGAEQRIPVPPQARFS